MKLSFLLLALLFSIFPLCARAVAPHQVVLLVNRNSIESRHIANVYSHLRRIPDENIVLLDLPRPGSRPFMTPKEFEETIREPTEAALQERGLTHVLAWIYSVDFPTTVRSTQHLSLHGMTLAGPDLPEPNQIRNGQWLSPFWAGPDGHDRPKFPAMSLDRYRQHLQETYRPASMSLGHIGSFGNTPEDVLRGLRRAIASDGTHSDAPVWVLSSTDVRSTCRAWQWEGVGTELEAQGRELIVSEAYPDRSVSGFITGSSWLSGRFRDKLVPGALAENLTSFGANFSTKTQTKTSLFISLGSAASTGTITEPFSIWTKFPHARCHVHLGTGLTILESLHSAVRCPLQLYFVGEPLARPFARRLNLRLQAGQTPHAANANRNHLTVHTTVTPATDERLLYTWLLDGRLIAGPTPLPQANFDLATLPPGYHTLRVIVGTDGNVGHFALAEYPLRSSQTAYTIDLEAAEPTCPRGARLPLRIRTHGNLESFQVLQGEELVYQPQTMPPDDENFVLNLPTASLAPGPVRLRIRATFSDGTVAHSAPARVTLTEPEPPSITAEPTARPGTWTIRLNDPRNFPLRQQLLHDLTAQVRRENSDIVPTEDRLTAPPERATHAWVASVDERPHTLTATVEFGRHKSKPDNFQGLLIFNFRSENRFDYFGMDADKSAWVFGHFRKGKLQHQVELGRPCHYDTPYRLSVHQEGRELVGKVNGRTVLRWRGARMSSRRVGVACQGPVRSTFTAIGVGFDAPQAVAQASFPLQIQPDAPRILLIDNGHIDHIHQLAVVPE